VSSLNREGRKKSKNTRYHNQLCCLKLDETGWGIRSAALWWAMGEAVSVGTGAFKHSNSSHLKQAQPTSCLQLLCLPLNACRLVAAYSSPHYTSEL